VLIGGTMGTYSYILHGTAKGMAETFGSACHGAGRAMSRMQAKKKWRADNLMQEMKKQGIFVRGKSKAGLVEEAPGSYKDVDQVVGVMHEAGIARKVVRLKPIVVIKG
jgi:tRNA-splicing ligase RtcB